MKSEKTFPLYSTIKIDTCISEFWFCEKYVRVYSITNKEPNNGSLEYLLNTYYDMCKLLNRDLLIMDLFNRKFKTHLIEKRGFEAFDKDHALKKINIFLNNQ